jgi:ABC-type transporter Mla subunit MlaD
VNVGRDVYGLQAGTVGSTQDVTVELADERQAIEAFLAEVRRQLDRLPLSIEQLEGVREDLQTAETQLQSARPRHAILQAAVSSLREVVLGAAGSGAFAGLVELAQHIHS